MDWQTPIRIATAKTYPAGRRCSLYAFERRGYSVFYGAEMAGTRHGYWLRGGLSRVRLYHLYSLRHRSGESVRARLLPVAGQFFFSESAESVHPEKTPRHRCPDCRYQ